MVITGQKEKIRKNIRILLFCVHRLLLLKDSIKSNQISQQEWRWWFLGKFYC